jgi:hypothetical protein
LDEFSPVHRIISPFPVWSVNVAASPRRAVGPFAILASWKLALPGNLHSKTGETIVDLLLGLARERSKTLLVVTHDNQLARRGDRTLRIIDGVLAA